MTYPAHGTPFSVTLRAWMKVRVEDFNVVLYYYRKLEEKVGNGDEWGCTMDE